MEDSSVITGVSTQTSLLRRWAAPHCAAKRDGTNLLGIKCSVYLRVLNSMVLVFERFLNGSDATFSTGATSSGKVMIHWLCCKVLQFTVSVKNNSDVCLTFGSGLRYTFCSVALYPMIMLRVQQRFLLFLDHR